ncbi:MAG: plastocyanin/azurin family copper-binding protein [Chloroflexota bacterium]
MNTPIRTLLLIALLALGLAACSRDSSPGASAPPSAAGTAVAAGPVVGTLEFEGYELGFRPATVQVDQPGTYAVTFTNTGHTDHDLVAGDTRLVARPGETVRGEIVVPPGGLEFVCSFPGHAAAGMRGTITVREVAAGQPEAAGGQQ